jgi:two-component sensor histidine kinase
MKEAHISLVMLLETMGRPQAALDHLRAYHALSDSLMNAGTNAAMEELRLRYDTEKTERENHELRASAELSALRAGRDRWIAIGMTLVALSLAAMAWTVVQRNKQRARQREAELEQQALRLQMDPHFLFNALNTIPGLYASGDPGMANDHVGHLSKFLRLVLETSRRRTIPLAQEIELVENYIRICANRRPDKFTWELKVMPYVRPERLAVPPMLIQPLVENALEHGLNGSTKGHISILVDLAGSVLHVEVVDNGIGHKAASRGPSRHESTSLGIDLVRKRIMLFDKQANLGDAVLVRESVPADPSRPGTIVTLRFRPQAITEHVEDSHRG